ncbi:hypothetical protein TKK_0002581 [Trichogramma kaykai]
MLYSSRISNNRACIYVSSKELVEKITNKSPFLTINSIQVAVRPLVAKLQKVVISNVAPPIPHYIVQSALENLNIKCCSPIVTLKAAINKEGYSHVLSSRRQTYIDPKDSSKIPEFIKIDYDETTYYVYPSINTTIRCFACKSDGHIAKHCPADASNGMSLFQGPSINNSQTSQNNLQETTNRPLTIDNRHLLDTLQSHDSSPISAEENDVFRNAKDIPDQTPEIRDKGGKRIRSETASSTKSVMSPEKKRTTVQI